MAVTAMGAGEYWATLIALIVLTVADTVLCTVNLYYYTDTYVPPLVRPSVRHVQLSSSTAPARYVRSPAPMRHIAHRLARRWAR